MGQYLRQESNHEKHEKAAPRSLMPDYIKTFGGLEYKFEV